MIDKNDPRLTDFLLGELDTRQQAEIQSAIDQDPEFALAVNELRQTIELIGQSYQTEPVLALSNEQLDELRGATVAKPGIDGANGSVTNSLQPPAAFTLRPGPGRSLARSSIRTRLFVLAASLLLLLAGGSLWFVNGWRPIPMAAVSRFTADAERTAAEPTASVGDLEPSKSKDLVDTRDGGGIAVEKFYAPSRSARDYANEVDLKEKSQDLAEEMVAGKKFTDLESQIAEAVQSKAWTGSGKAADGVGDLNVQLDLQVAQSQQLADPALLVDPIGDLPEALRYGGIIAGKGQPRSDQEYDFFDANAWAAPEIAANRELGSFGGGLGGGLGGARPDVQIDDSRPSPGLAEADLPAVNPQGFAFIPNQSLLQAGQDAPLSAAIQLPQEMGRELGGNVANDFIELTAEPTGESQLFKKSETDMQTPDESKADLSRSQIADNANHPTAPTSDSGLASRAGGVAGQMGAGQRGPGTQLQQELDADSKLAQKGGFGESLSQIPARQNSAETAIAQSASPAEAKRYLAISPAKAQEIASQLASRVDPQSSNEIQIVEPRGVTLGQNANLDDAVKVIEEEPASGKITLRGDATDLKIVESLIREMAQKNGIEEDQQDRILWKQQVQQALDLRNQKIRRANTWKRVKAVPNASRLMIGEDDELPISGMQVNVQVDGFRARVLIDCFYYNDRDQQLEGNFKLRLPDDASLYYFAFGESAYEYTPNSDWVKNEFIQRSDEDGSQFVSLNPANIRNQRQDDWKNCKEAKMVPRERAAFAYNQTMRRRIDPALVEWSGAGVFNARVFPLSPRKMHRIVMGYDVNLVRTDEGWNYQLDLPEQTGQCQVDIHVTNLKDARVSVEAADQQDAKIVRNHFHFTNPQTEKIRVDIERTSDVMLTASDQEEGDFWGVQFVPQIPADQVAGNPKAIFLLDTSLSSRPDKFTVWLKLLRSTLDQNRDSIRQFNVVFFDVGSSFWRKGYVENTAENVNALLDDCDGLSLEGATDLYGAVEKVATADWIYGDNSAGPDLFLLSDGAANWGEIDLRLIQRLIVDNRLGNLFAYQTGLTGTAIANLRFLANATGGSVFSVATEDEIKTASAAHRNRPWQLTAISAEGARDVMTAGRVQWIYPGQTLMVVGRGKPIGELKLELSQAGQNKLISLPSQIIQSELAPRLYGQVAVGQLESLGSPVVDVAAAYARHFRVTGQTCSLLMLETEAEYEQFGIKPQEDLFVIKSKFASELVTETLKRFASELADPKSQMLAWIKRLESMPGMQFQIPTALNLVLDKLKIEAVSRPLESDPRASHESTADYGIELSNEDLKFDVIATESQRRAAKSVDEAIKVLSNLVERNPSDLVVARDVAFSAMELDRPAQAYSLLLNVVKARPYECSVYSAIAQCLARLKEADMAILFYEIALSANFQNRDQDFQKIVAADYLHLLREISSGEMTTSVPEFAEARQATLRQTLGFDTADLLITMMWNTDQTDVDLHIVEPTGEECSYENRKTRIGGQITSDITTGFGPEMYWLQDATEGKYNVQAQLFNSDQNRVSLRNKVYLTIYKNYGKPDERVSRKTIQLKTVGEKESISTVGVDPK